MLIRVQKGHSIYEIWFHLADNVYTGGGVLSNVSNVL